MLIPLIQNVALLNHNNEFHCKKGLNLTITITILFILCNHVNANDTVNFQSENYPHTITISSEPDYPPYCLIDKNGNADGFSIDLFKATAFASGIETRIKIGVWHKIMEDLATGNIDALPLVGRTPEREEMFDFTFPYISLHGAIFVRKGKTGINHLSDLKNKEIIVMTGDNAEEFLRRENISDFIYTTNTFHEAFQLLEDGVHDAVITQRITGIKLLEIMGIQNIVPLDIRIPGFRQDFCFAVEKGNHELLSKLNEGLSIIIADGTYDEIHMKWFGPSLNGNLSFYDYFKISLYFLIPFFLIFSFFHIVFLRKEVRRRTKTLNDEISGHKKTLVNLQKQTQLLTEMEKISLVGGWEFNIKTNLFTWTSGIYDIYGILPESTDLNLEKTISFYDPEGKSMLEQAFNRALSIGQSFDLILKLHLEPEKEKWVRIKGNAHVKNGKVTLLTGSLLDVTERKKSEELIIASKEQFLLLLNTTAEGIFGVDKNGICTFCNNASIQILGYENENQIKGKNIHALIHSININSVSNHPIDDCHILNTFKSGIRVHINNEFFRRADGSIFPVEYWSHPIVHDGDISGLVVTFHDISIHKNMISELSQTKDYLENLIHYASAPIIVWNNQFEIERLNEAVARLTGRTKDELLNENIEILFPVAKKKESLSLINNALQGERWESVEIEVQHKDGSIKTVLWNSSNIMNTEKTKIISTIAQGQNITGRKKAENALLKLSGELEKKVAERTKELNDNISKLDKSQKALLFMVEDLNNVTAELKNESHKLELSNKELEAFSYSVSHDLRAPLRAIDGFSKFLMEDYYDKLDDEGKRLLMVIKENAVKMDQLISDLLNLSKISRVEIKYSQVEMKPVILSMYHEVATGQEKKDFTLEIGKLPSVYCDSNLIKQVWQNLLGNALKYSSKSPVKKIEISSTEKNGMYVFNIKDHGAGFDPSYKDKLFKAFQRLHREDEFPGTGIGLSIIQRIVYRHGGEVWANGNINMGATFSFSLPVKDSVNTTLLS